MMTLRPKEVCPRGVGCENFYQLYDRKPIVCEGMNPKRENFFVCELASAECSPEGHADASATDDRVSS